jgi:NAD(P)H-dependent FMN reductase
MPLKLQTIICSTRPGRVGPIVATWFHERAREHGLFEAALIDLAAFNLPIFDEPHHPRLQKYEKEHTKAWSASVGAADAFVFVTPEYNNAPPPSLVNALDYLNREWQYKPAGFVSYGGVSGGLRAVQAVKPIMTVLKMMPIPEAVAIPSVSQQIRDGRFVSNDLIDASVTPLLNELHRWADALKTLRA